MVKAYWLTKIGMATEKPKQKNSSIEKDVLLACAFAKTSLDAVNGLDQKPTFFGSRLLKYSNFYTRRISDLKRSLKYKDVNSSVSVFKRLFSQLSPSSWQSKIPPKCPVERVPTLS